MKSKLSLLIAIILSIASIFLAFAAFMISRSAKDTAMYVSKGDNSSPNEPLVVDRIESEAERTRMEKYVADLQASKRVVKTLQGLSGETIDCVDIFAQPALKRRGMEGHQVQLAPSSQPPTEAKPEAVQHESRIPAPDQLYSITGEICGERTAPMTRLTMDTLKRFRNLDEFFQKKSDIERPTGGGGGSSTHEYAHAYRTVDNWGAESIFNVWSPYNERSDEFSLSQIWVVRGSGGDRETVEGGWQKYRDLYGDWRSHLFIYFTPDNYGSGGCYNLSCSGFVQVNNTVYIGGGFTNYSSEGGTQYEFKLLWYKDGTEGHWWLKYGDTWVGYYPRSLFDANGLRNNGAKVDYGGEIVNKRTDNRHTRTDMGSGNWPYQGFGQAAYQRRIRYVDTSNFYQHATNLNRSVTNDRCYDLDLLSSSGDWEEYFYFGGSGYNTQCQ
jgi:Neprosin/Neprosin activation peptide